jgi:F-box protein 25/32
MGGATQRIMLTLLEQIAAYVRENNNCGSDTIKLLLADLRQSLLKYGCWGRPLGSTYLWDEHKQRIEKLQAFGSRDFVCAAGDLHQLPEEVVREVILKLNHHFDLNNLSASSEFFKQIVGESRIWREMCSYHFTDEQITQMIEKCNGNFTWQEIYHKLKRKHGLVEKYAEEINLCKTCRTLFWPSYGHACLSTPVLISLKPEDFIKLFSL